MKNITAFDAADYLDNDVVIAKYLNAALEDENPKPVYYHAKLNGQ